MCLECHRPDGGRQSRYHPQNFVTRHPSSAYAREANCSDCHNPAQFCQSCHQRAGLVATARIGQKGYHDAFRGFSLSPDGKSFLTSIVRTKLQIYLMEDFDRPVRLADRWWRRF